MKRRLKFIGIFLSFIIFFVLASLGHIAVTLFPFKRWHLMSRGTRILMRLLQKILGLQIKVEGHTEYLQEQGNLIISRHVSYTDGLILGGLLPAILVSKKNVQRWPLFGQVIAISGTVFVDRGNNKVFDYIDRMISLLKSKITVIIFPEGTSTNGAVVKPFQTVFFQVPLEVKTDIIPMTISYLYLDGRRITQANQDHVFWYGQTSFFKHLWNLLQFNRIDVTVTVHEKIKAETFTNSSVGRKTLSQRCQEFISSRADVQNHLADKTAPDNGILASPSCGGGRSTAP